VKPDSEPCETCGRWLFTRAAQHPAWPKSPYQYETGVVDQSRPPTTTIFMLHKPARCREHKTMVARVREKGQA
jgi:hypothetical protein